LLVEAHAAAEMTIANAQETLHPDGRPFVFKGPGWYQYQHDAILVAPCSRRSGAGDQHYLFSIFLGAAENVRQAMAWAATAPTRPTPAPDDEASGPASGFRWRERAGSDEAGSAQSGGIGGLAGSGRGA